MNYGNQKYQTKIHDRRHFPKDWDLGGFLVEGGGDCVWRNRTNIYPQDDAFWKIYP